ncbi:MAG: ferritin-like domain-containing protein [bacterium]
MTTPYTHLLNRKRTWTPVPITQGKLKEGGEEVIQRALSLRCLEIPVADFITDATKRELPQTEGCLDLLKSNIVDENNHDEALNFAAAAHPVPQNFEDEADRIKKSWLDLDRHPILKAVVLERSIFFVLLPMFRYLGDTGLRTVSQDVSRDETVHVCSNTLVCNALKLQSDDTINRMRRDVMDWVLQPLEAESEDKHLSSNFWMKASDNLYSRGKAEELAQTRASRMPAFFETNNKDLPMYA